MLLLFSGSATAQVNNPAYANYFLVGQFGEVCTMCEVIVYCSDDIYDTPREALPEEGSYTVYHLQTRTFWSQVSTIWEWFISNFATDSLARSGHTRPVKVYTVEEGDWSGPEIIEAHLSLEPALLTFGDRRIDRVERRWLSGDDNELEGFCQRMPLWESIAMIDAKVPEGVQP
jgi:hypothetical protein